MPRIFVTRQVYDLVKFHSLTGELDTKDTQFHRDLTVSVEVSEETLDRLNAYFPGLEPNEQILKLLSPQH